MKYRKIEKTNLDDLLKRQKEEMLVNQILSGNTFMTAEEHRPIKIKDVDPLSSTEILQNLIWDKNVMVKKLFIDENNCIVSEVFLNEKSLKELLGY